MQLIVYYIGKNRTTDNKIVLLLVQIIVYHGDKSDDEYCCFFKSSKLTTHSPTLTTSNNSDYQLLSHQTCAVVLLSGHLLRTFVGFEVELRSYTPWNWFSVNLLIAYWWIMEHFWLATDIYIYIVCAYYMCKQNLQLYIFHLCDRFTY